MALSNTSRRRLLRNMPLRHTPLFIVCRSFFYVTTPYHYIATPLPPPPSPITASNTLISAIRIRHVMQRLPWLRHAA